MRGMSVLLPEADTVRPAKHVQKVVISNLALVRIRLPSRADIAAEPAMSVLRRRGHTFPD